MLTYLSKEKTIKLVCKLQVKQYSPSPFMEVIAEESNFLEIPY